MLSAIGNGLEDSSLLHRVYKPNPQHVHASECTGWYEGGTAMIAVGQVFLCGESLSRSSIASVVQLVLSLGVWKVNRILLITS